MSEELEHFFKKEEFERKVGFSEVFPLEINERLAQEGLEELEKTELWDKKREQWNWEMTRDQKLLNSDRRSETQLLGVLVKAATGNTAQAKEMLGNLKQTDLWDEKRKQWNWWMNENQELEDSNRSSYAQLVGVLAEAVTGNIEQAKEMLKSLKQTELWDKEREQWNWEMTGDQKLLYSNRYAEAQLVGVLAEAATGNVEEAKKMLKNLKQTELWDKGTEQWNWQMTGDQKFFNSDRHSEAQLLGVLAEAATGNVEEAKKMLKNLKQTELWDKKTKQWNWSMNADQQWNISLRRSDAQLLSILAEALK